MSISTHAYEIIQIPHARVEILTLARRQRVDMMYNNAVVDLIPFDAEVATEVSCNGLGPSFSPNIALVETLVHPAMTTERLSEKCAVE
jgi:hypothetical protein